MFPSPCGVWVVSYDTVFANCKSLFPSPCGVWVVSHYCKASGVRFLVSVPLRGVGCFRSRGVLARLGAVSVPLRGVGCFCSGITQITASRRFRPLAGCGLFHRVKIMERTYRWFPSPCGVWVVSTRSSRCIRSRRRSFRPLAGCGLFPSGRCLRHGLSGVSVPLRGVGCFR